MISPFPNYRRQQLDSHKNDCHHHQVKCLSCQLESARYENIMDLTLEIHGWVESLEDALTQFTASEELDGENMYRCRRYDDDHCDDGNRSSNEILIIIAMQVFYVC